MKLINNCVIVGLLLQTCLQLVNCHELQAFMQHLDWHHLRHAIIIHSASSLMQNNKSEMLQVDKFNQKHLLQLIQQYAVRFFSANANIDKFNQMFYLNSPRVGLYMHYPMVAHDKGKVNVLTSASLNGRFNYSSSWFITMGESAQDPLERVHNVFSDLNIQINADITVGIAKRSSTLELYDIYKICHKCGTPLKMHHKGNWSEQNGYQIEGRFRDSFVSRRNNFKNVSIEVASALVNKYASINMTDMEFLENTQDYLQVDTMQRKTYQLLKMAQGLYNFTFDTRIENAWGLLINGSWTGVMGLLENGEVEFSLCPLRYKSDRSQAIKYSAEVHVERIRFLLRHPKRSSIRNIFFEPLDETVWWCVLALIVITTILLAIHVHTEHKLHCQQKRHTKGGQNTERHLNFMLLTILEAIFMQGPSPEHFRNNSTRLLLVSVSVFSVLLMQFYGAFIVSSLLSEPPRTITNLPALYDSNLEIGMENVSYHYEIFTNTSNQVARKIYKQRICNKPSNHIISLEKGVQRIAKGGFAMYITIDRAYRLLEKLLTQTHFCELQEIRFNAGFASGVGFGKSSPYSKFIQTAIAKFRESSLLQYNERRWEVHKIDCSAIHDAEVKVDLVHFAPVLVFLAFSTLASVWVLIVELCYKRSKERTQLSTRKAICKTMRNCGANKQ